MDKIYIDIITHKQVVIEKQYANGSVLVRRLSDNVKYRIKKEELQENKS